MSASAEDEEIGPSIDAVDPEERIAARRLRIAKRLEQLRRYFNDVDKRTKHALHFPLGSAVVYFTAC